MATVLVTGGTGVLGRRLVPRLAEAGHEVRVLTRKTDPSLPDGIAAVGGDLSTGDGLEKAVSGTDAVVHAGSDPRQHRMVDVAGTRHLLEALTISAPRSHLAYISIVGVDRHPLPYYRSKLAAERAIADAPQPWSILRATQFHQLLAAFLGRVTRSPIVPVPREFRFQPIDAGEVATRLAELVDAGASGRVPELGGPAIHDARYLASTYLDAKGKRRPIFAVPIWGSVGRAYREGLHLTEERSEGRTWERFLIDEVVAR